eukprot:TRINITY_DN2118_c0_g1_i2.p1 TRINITY_DN2118_c0_g1~~TRINITY_DN2118_c0_g1_i2.p1  ORF type:complete len:563 (-),score=125.06 TRINITY_DN2118_c0_g1_i2:61-1749(-)
MALRIVESSMAAMASVLLPLLLISFVCLAHSQSYPISTLVSTQYGDVQGFQDETTGTFVFLGIPYAQPPVGSLRWSSPLYPSDWDSVYNATYYRPSCIQSVGSNQLYTATDEDCLYLNVFVPEGTIVNDSSSALPVRVFIHGGDFTEGGAILYDSRLLSAMSGQVVVTINYRLGVFGFLATSNLVDENPVLNWGLQDQRLALYWVQMNILNFGGDINNVLIFGESAGGASVVYHLISQDSWGLYNRIITESPGPWWYSSASAAIRTNEEIIVSSSNCTDLSLSCLRSLPTETLNNMAELHQLPVVNGQVADLADQPYRLIRNGLFNREVDYLIGSNAYEGTVFIFESDGLTVNLNATQYDTTLTTSVVGNNFPESFVSHIKDIFQPIQQTQGYFAAASGYAGDFFIICGTRNLVNSAYNYTKQNDDDKSQIWRYVFSHAPSNWSIGSFHLEFLNATHGTELPYVFAETIFGIELGNAEEVQLSKQIIEYWSQFASCGNPNGIVGLDSSSSYGYPQIWPTYNPTNANSTIINLNLDFGLTSDVWGYYCEQLEDLIFLNSTVPF